MYPMLQFPFYVYYQSSLLLILPISSDHFYQNGPLVMTHDTYADSSLLCTLFHLPEPYAPDYIRHPSFLHIYRT